MCSNRCRKGLPHGLRRKTLRTATGRRRWPKQKKKPARGSTLVRRRTGFQFLILLFPQQPGGRYVVATGAIIWGAIQAIKGLVVILKIQHQEGRFTAFWRTAALAACSLAALLYLGQLSVRLAGGEEMQVVDTEQIYTGAQGNQGEDSRRIHPARRNRAAPKRTKPTPTTVSRHPPTTG